MIALLRTSLSTSKIRVFSAVRKTRVNDTSETHACFKDSFLSFSYVLELGLGCQCQLPDVMSYQLVTAVFLASLMVRVYYSLTDSSTGFISSNLSSTFSLHIVHACMYVRM